MSLKIIKSMLFILSSTLVFGQDCKFYYTKEINLGFNEINIKSDHYIPAIANGIVNSLKSLDQPVSRLTESTIDKLKAVTKFGVSESLEATIADLGTQTQYVSEINSRIEVFNSRIEEINKQITIYKKSAITEKKSLSKGEIESLTKLDDLFKGIKEDLDFIKQRKAYLEEIKKALEKNYSYVVEVERKSLEYAHLVSGVLINLENRPQDYAVHPQKMVLIISRLQSEQQAVVMQLENIKRVKELIDTNLSIIANATVVTEMNTNLNMQTFMVGAGFSPAFISKKLESYQSQIQEIQARAQKIKDEKDNKRKRLSDSWERNKSFFKRMAVVGSIMFASGTGMIMKSNSNYENELKYRTASVQVFESADKSFSDLLKKYQNGLSEDIKTAAVDVNSFEQIAQLIKNSTRPKDPREIIFLLNYNFESQKMILKKGTSSIGWESYYGIVQTVLSFSVTRDYTAEEKKDLISTINSSISLWKNFYLKKKEIGIISQDEYQESIDLVEREFKDPLLAHFDQIKAQKNRIEAEKLKRQNEIENEIKAKQRLKELLSLERSKLSNVDDIHFVSEYKANPKLKLMFEADTQTSFLLQLLEFSKNNTFSASDVFYIVKKMQRFEINKALKTNEGFAEFLTKVSKASKGSLDEKTIDSSTNVSFVHIVLDRVFKNINPTEIGAVEFKALKEMIKESKHSTVYDSEGDVQPYTTYMNVVKSIYFSTLAEKLKVIDLKE